MQKNSYVIFTYSYFFLITNISLLWKQMELRTKKFGVADVPKAHNIPLILWALGTS